MATNALGAVKLPAYVTDPKRRRELPPAPVAPPIPPPPSYTPASEYPRRAMEAAPAAFQKAKEFLRTPPSQQAEMLPTGVQSAGRGVMRGASEVGEQMAEKPSLAALTALTVGAGLAPAVVMRLVGLGLSAVAIKDLADTAPDALEAFKRGDDEEGFRLATHGAVQAGMALAGPKLGKTGRTTPSGPPLSQQLGKLGGEEGFMSIEFFDRSGKFIGRENFQGKERLPGDIGFGKLPRGTKANVVVRSAPVGRPGSEANTVLGYLVNKGVDFGDVAFATELRGAREPIGGILHVWVQRFY